jgi:tetratricopeptide (TPR) repeat protein
MINCPVCNTKNELSKKTICSKCGEDLTSLGRLMELPLHYYNEGLRLAKEKKWDEAIVKLSVASEMKKGYAEPLSVMGKVYAQKEMYNEAIGCWQRVMELDPDNTMAQKAIERAKEVMERKKTKENKVETELNNNVHRILKLSKLTPALSGVIALLLISLIAFLWHNLEKQNSRISELNSQLSGLRVKTNGDIGSLSGQIRNLSASNINKFQKADNRITDIQKSQKSDILSLDRKIIDLIKNQTITADGLKNFSRQLTAISATSNKQISAMEKVLVNDLSHLKDQLQDLSAAIEETQSEVSAAIEEIQKDFSENKEVKE